MKEVQENGKAPKKIEFIFQSIIIISLICGGILQKTAFDGFAVACWILAGVGVVLWVLTVRKDKEKDREGK